VTHLTSMENRARINKFPHVRVVIAKQFLYTTRGPAGAVGPKRSLSAIY
jgi:hypothetical protein